jgi:ABC-type Fe3+-hydroxamate transport system substrate-binding protein
LVDTKDQWNEFYVKKGKYLVELSENHYSNKEYKKSLELLSQAYNMYKKGNAIELAKQTKKRFEEIKAKHFKKKNNF